MKSTTTGKGSVNVTTQIIKKCKRQLAEDCGELFSTCLTFFVVALVAVVIGQFTHLVDGTGLASKVVVFILTFTEHLLLAVDCYALVRRVWKHANKH